MKKILVVLGVLILSGNTIAMAATDTIRTYRSDWTPSQTFKDGDMIYVTVWDGITTGTNTPVVSKPTIQVTGQGGSIDIVVNDCGLAADKKANDGIFSGTFYIKKDITTSSGENFKVGNGGQGNLTADLDGNGDSGYAFIIGDHLIPEVYDLVTSDSCFSPTISPGIQDVATISFKSSETGKYRITIDGRVPGTISANYLPSGTITADTLVSFPWNGKDQYGVLFREGSHTVAVVVEDSATNISAGKQIQIRLDETSPTAFTLWASDYFFSPGASPGAQDETSIQFQGDERLTYELRIDGQVPLGIGLSSGIIIPGSTATTFVWQGQYEGGISALTGTRTVSLKVTDDAGNSTLYTIYIVIDNDPPSIVFATEDTGGLTKYLGQTIWFSLKATDNFGAKEGSSGVSFGSRYVRLIDYGQGIYKGYYKVSLTDLGTFYPQAFFSDSAGNPATAATFASPIILDGTRIDPSLTPFIARIGVLTPEKGTFAATVMATSTDFVILSNSDLRSGDWIKAEDSNSNHTWLAFPTQRGQVTLSNANLYYGAPFQDYSGFNTSNLRCAQLKGAIKRDDEITLTLTTISFLEQLAAASKTSTMGIVSGNFGITDMVVAYDSAGHIWLGTPSTPGTFILTNANLFGGSLVTDYLKLGEISAATAKWATNGKASVDLGVIAQGITLYDDGLSQHQDTKNGDGIYTNVYTIKEDKDTISKIVGHFFFNGQQADNDGLVSQQGLSIDATPPNITNFGAFPSLFRPGTGTDATDVTIKYTLLEKAEVTIEIFDSYGRLVKKLTPPWPWFGDNANVLWDGKNEAGLLVEDGDYHYHINAVDEAGNQAIERVGLIKVTRVEIKVHDLLIAPSQFVPTPKVEKDTDVIIYWDVSLKANTSQLENLGFRMNPNDLETLPYVLCRITVFDANGNELVPCKFPDLTEDCDTDPFPSQPRWKPDMFNYYTGPRVTNNGMPKLGDERQDVGDGDKTNDWDFLMPLHQVGSDTYQLSDFGVRFIDWAAPNGTYIVRVWAELVSAWWKWTNSEANPPDPVEKWHYQPEFTFGYSLSANPIDGRIEVIDSPVTEPDNVKPNIVTVFPAPTTIHEPTENIGTIAVTLLDGGGSGIDLNSSEIRLENSSGLVVPGYQTNNGVNTIFWVLDKYLTDPDNYSILVKPIDNARNGSADKCKEFSFTIADREGPKIIALLVNETELKQGQSFGRDDIKSIKLILSEVETGKSEVDLANSKVIIKRDDGTEVNIGLPKLEPIDANNGAISYDLKSLMLTDGTYTISVNATDKASPPNTSFLEKPYTIFITSKGYIFVNFVYPGTISTKTILSIRPDTFAGIPGTPSIEVGTDTITVGTTTEEPKATNRTAIGEVFEFFFKKQRQDITFTNDITLTLYYDQDKVPAGISESQLLIYELDDGVWNKGDGAVDENNNLIKVTVAKLKDKYAIMYVNPGEVPAFYQDKVRLTIPANTKVNTVFPGTQTITIVEAKDPGAHPDLEVIGPIVTFLFNGEAKEITFDEPGKLFKLDMWYTNSDVTTKLIPTGLKEEDIFIYHFNKTSWEQLKPVEPDGRDTEKNMVTSTPSKLNNQYALMFRKKEAKPEEAAQTFKESVCVYPNPVKSNQVTFRYNLDKNAKITIKVYTIMGQLVWEKEYSDLAGTAIKHTWDLKNESGNAIATGVYICRITADDRTEEVTVTKKLIVVQ